MTGKNTMIKDVKDYLGLLPDSYFSKAASIIFYKTDIGKDFVFPLSKFVDLIGTLGEGFHSEELAGHLRRVGPNESGSLDHFPFIKWHVDMEASLNSTDEEERLASWTCKVILMYLQEEMFLNIHALKREQDQERISLKEGSIFQTLSQGISSTAHIQKSRDRMTGLHLNVIKSIKKLRVN